MPLDFECHITIILAADLNEGWQMSLECMARQADWKVSFIEGDPDLGHGHRYFLTKHFEDLEAAKQKTDEMADALRKAGFTVARKKIEQVLHDTRNGTWP